MNKVVYFFKKIGELLKKIPKVIKARAMSTQLIITIILIFGSFFLLQVFLNITFFEKYYSEREFDRIHSELMTYVNNLNEKDSDDYDYYDEMYKFTSENNAYSVIVRGSYQMYSSSANNYTVKIVNNNPVDINNIDEYLFLVPNNDYQYSTNEILNITMYRSDSDDWIPTLIRTASNDIYNPNYSCIDDTCISISATVVDVNKPSNLNYLYGENILVERELSKLYNKTIDIDDYSYQTGSVVGSWYISSDGPVDTLVFVHNIKRWDWIVTVVPIANTKDIISITSNYNYYLYATALVIIFLWSFRLSNIISKPVQNIELVAREIAQLNFNVEAHEYNNRENESLSRSINLISRNLKETLETISAKNTELTDLYNEQSNQVSLKKQLVSSISHELKTPLMIMQVTIQGILDGIIEQGEQEKELNNVLFEINKSSIMIQDMLQIYRLDDASTELEICEFNLSNTLNFFIKDFDSAIKKYDFKMDLNIPEDVYIEADNKLIKRVISNFLTNAIKYTTIGETIQINLIELDDVVTFELINRGAQIEHDELENIWMPFYRIEIDNISKRKTKGSGIGLYLVSEILKAHQADFGIVNVENGVKAYFTINKKAE